MARRQERLLKKRDPGLIMQRHHGITLTEDGLRQEWPKSTRKEKNIDPS
jgi:hypothetical protein